VSFCFFEFEAERTVQAPQVHHVLFERSRFLHCGGLQFAGQFVEQLVVGAEFRQLTALADAELLHVPTVLYRVPAELALPRSVLGPPGFLRFAGAASAPACEVFFAGLPEL